jgi:hypothetical protein
MIRALIKRNRKNDPNAYKTLSEYIRECIDDYLRRFG